MNRSLVVTGAAMVALGAVLLIVLFAQGGSAEVAGGTPVPDPSFLNFHSPSRLWAVIIGLTIALGAGLIGIGMNRWKGEGE